MKRDKRILIAVSEEEIVKLKEKAAIKGLSLSAYLRMQGLK